MASCRGRTKSGKRCRALAGPNGYCSIHAKPGAAVRLGKASGEARRKAAHDAMMLVAAPANSDELKLILAQSMSNLLSGKLSYPVARTAAVLGSTLLKAFEQADIARKLEELCKAMEEQGGSGSPGSSQGNNVRRPNDVEE